MGSTVAKQVHAVTINDVLKDHISKTYLQGEQGGLTETTPLLGLNIIDSSRLFELVHFIGSEFAVKIPFDQIVPENFESITAIRTLIERIRASSTSNG
jgi:acyl carrier protein